MAKRPGSFTFTFSRRNSDVKDFIEEKKKDKNFVATDYFCEASRFYEKYRNKDELKNLIIEIMKKDIPMQISSISNEQLNSAASRMIDASFDGKVDDIDDDCLEED